MVERRLSSPAFDKPLQLQPEQPAETRLNIGVVFTSIDATLGALRKAAALAASLSAQITLLVPQVVPFPLPLTSPPILVEFNERRFRTLASQIPVPTGVLIYLCRDAQETLTGVLPPRSTLVIGGRRRWWPTYEMRLAKRLRKCGHEVIFTETE